MMLADKILNFYQSLGIPSEITPKHVSILNPVNCNSSNQTQEATRYFYRKFYSDQNQRIILLGINPGRFGAGLTGIPFTDPKHLKQLGIPWNGSQTHEPSSVFIYNVIDAFGGADLFYKKFYFSSVCPLGFVKLNEKNKPVNFNYYDDAAFTKSLEPLIVQWLQEQIQWGLRSDICLCIGAGKNYKVLTDLNKRHGIFENIECLPHPRYIMQYKYKEKQDYLNQ